MTSEDGRPPMPESLRTANAGERSGLMPDVARTGRTATMLKSGHFLDDVVSALQKCIRRGMEEDALFWAQSMELGDRSGSSYWAYCFKRLSIIACEDVGVNNPQALKVVLDCWSLYERIKKSGGKDAFVDGDVMAMAVLYLCRSPKNREVDHLKNHLEGRVKRGWIPEIPDFAFDQHTARGRALRRGNAHWWQEGAHIENAQGPDDYKDSEYIDRR